MSDARPPGPPSPDPARARWLAMALARIAGSAGAVFGVVLIGRATSFGPRLLGLAITLSALAMMVIVQRHLARRWRSGG
jgi:hypothetical protein